MSHDWHLYRIIKHIYFPIKGSHLYNQHHNTTFCVGWKRSSDDHGFDEVLHFTVQWPLEYWTLLKVLVHFSIIIILFAIIDSCMVSSTLHRCTCIFYWYALYTCQSNKAIHCPLQQYLTLANLIFKGSSLQRLECTACACHCTNINTRALSIIKFFGQGPAGPPGPPGPQGPQNISLMRSSAMLLTPHPRLDCTQWGEL